METSFWANFFKVSAIAMDIFMFITVPIYILILITLWKYRKEEGLKHAFYRLMISVGISDIGTTLTIYLTFRLAELGWIPEVFIWVGKLASRLGSTGKYFFGNAQTMEILVIAFNRYTAYMMPLQHQRLWRQGKFLLWAIAGIWTIAFLTIIPLLFLFEFVIVPSPLDNKTIYLQWDSVDDLFYYALPVRMVGKGLIVIIVFIIYGIIFVTAFVKYCQGGRAAINSEKFALNMAIIGFIHCIGLAIAVFFHIAEQVAWWGFHSNLFEPFTLEAVTFFEKFGNDLFSAVNPYALLIFLSAVRQHFVKMYPIRFLSICFPPKTNVVVPLVDSTRAGAQDDQPREL